ncbi:condensin complex protein MksE [Nautilia sp.]
MESVIFDILSKGIIISANSSKFQKEATWLMEDENYESLNKTLNRLGLYLIGENGYFYISKDLKADEEEKFFNSHKQLVLAIAQLKKIFIHLDKGHKIKKSEFIKRFESKKDEKIIKTLFDTDDLMEITDKLFSLLERNFVIEKRSEKDEYLVLNALNYYLDIVDALSEGDGDE